MQHYNIFAKFENDYPGPLLNFENDHPGPFLNFENDHPGPLLNFLNGHPGPLVVGEINHTNMNTALPNSTSMLPVRLEVK